MFEISKIYFSPASTTKKNVETIADALGSNSANYDLLHLKNPEEKVFGENDIVVVGMPVFAGRIPEIARERLEKFKSNNAKAIAIVNYGNRAYDDALLELKDILSDNGFKVISAGAFIAQHSMFPKVAEGRPDNDDKEFIEDFARKSLDKIESNNLSEIDVPGNKPYREYMKPSIHPVCNEDLCVFCFECAINCPVSAIPDDDPAGLDTDLCNNCTACIYICPEGARNYPEDLFRPIAEKFEKAYSDKKENEIFL